MQNAQQIHGTRYRYSTGCRCDACRGWESARKRRYKGQHPEVAAARTGPPLLIEGLIANLPPLGQPFTPQQQQRWLDAVKVNLDLIYGMDDE